MWHGPWKAEMALQVGWYIFQALGPCQTPNLANKKIRLYQGLHLQSCNLNVKRLALPLPPMEARHFVAKSALTPYLNRA
jgi:hypothetical protein